MAQDSPTVDAANGDEGDSQLALAVRAIERDPNLRFLVREFLTFCNVLLPTSVYADDPTRNAYNQGIHAAGVEFARMLTSAAPLIWPALINEDLRHALDTTDDA